MSAPGDVTLPPPEQLVERILRGDRSAESELVSRYRRGVLTLLRNASRDASIVEDLGQETFRLALEKIRSGALREPCKLSGFVCAVARNLTIAHFRRLASRRTSALADEPAIASADPNPLDEVLRAERGAVVRRVLAEMASKRDRRILFRFYIEEEDKHEICGDMGLTSQHFNRVLFRARERYRALYLEMMKKEPR
jgi:RNA polymerase sigma-70 factor (ECF subfamily)